MRAYNSNVVPGRIGGLKMTSEDPGPYRLRTASDAPYMGAYGYGRRESFIDKLGAWLATLARVAVATVILAAWLVAVYLYRDTPTELFGIGTGWLTVSHLLVPVGFFCVFMTNRRYGPAFAFAQVMMTLGAVIALVLFARDALNEFVPLDTVPAIREALAFGGAFLAASFVSIAAFDGARGPRWWTAPLIGFLTAAIVFATVFFTALYAGTSSGWMNQGLQYMGLIAGEGVLLLLPFWVLRRMVPPLPGFGGY